MKKESSAGFAIGIYSQEMVEENALEKFGPKVDRIYRKQAIIDGLVDSHSQITRKGWELLNDDINKLERNAMAWMRKKFLSAREEGHDRYGDLTGSFWFDPHNPGQAYLVELAANTGRQERIDMQDASFGDLAHSVFK